MVYWKIMRIEQMESLTRALEYPSWNQRNIRTLTVRNHIGPINKDRCHNLLRNHRETVEREKSLSSFMWDDKGRYLRFPRLWWARAYTQIFRRSFALSSPLYLSRKLTPTIRAARVRVQRHDWSFLIRLFCCQWFSCSRGSYCILRTGETKIKQRCDIA